jgi:HAD superfamily hydrolase (TIGR01509 family)
MLADITHFLFDLDGTLVDSSRLHEAAFRKVLARSRPDLLAGFDYRDVAGLSTQASLTRIGVQQSELTALTAAKQTHYRASLTDLKALPGAKDMLEMLKDRGAAVAIVSSASRESALLALAMTGLAPLATTLITAEDVTAAKPAPDPFLAALRHLNAEPSHSIAVEDAQAGIASARAAGLRVIGMHNAFLRGLSDFYFSDFAGLAEALA